MTGEGDSEPAGISGREVLAMFSEEEVSCIKEQFGDDIVDQIGDLRITSRLANSPSSRFLFECITQESINRIGLELIRIEADVSEETTACILEVLTDTPSAVDLRLGQLPEDIDVDAVHLLEAGLATIQCLNNEEALRTFIQINEVLDQRSPLRGSDILATLTPPELKCVQYGIEPGKLLEARDATVMESFGIAPGIFGCIEPANLSTMFITVSDSRLGGLSDETRSCAEGVLKAAIETDPHPHLIEFSFGVTDEKPEHYDEAIALSRQVFACMNADELLEVQKAIAEALHGE